MAGLSLRLGLGLQAGGQAAAAVLQPAGAPRGIQISNSEVDDGAAAGALVGTMLMVGGTEPGVFTLSSNPSSLWAIDGDRLEVAGDLSALGGTEETPVVKVTDALGQTFEAILPITIAETAAGNDSGIGEDDGAIVTPDPDDPASDGGGFEITPIQQDTSDGLKVSGKNGGSATFLKDLGAPVAGNTYAMKYSADWSGMTKLGRQAAIGFAFKSGNDFHLVGLRGDGAPATTMLASRIHGDFRKSNQFTVTDDGAAAHGTKDGPNWLQLVIAGDGTTYTLSSSADGASWSAEYTDTLPVPLASADAALQFGPGGYFTNQDKGVFSITIETFEGLAEVDPHFANVVLLVSFDGADGATSATDDSNSAHALTFVGNAQIDTAQSKFGGASLLLDGTGDIVTAANSTDFQFGSGEFTIECFSRFTSLTSNNYLVALYDTNGQRSWAVARASGSSGALQFITSTTGASGVVTVAETTFWSVDTQYHITVDRDASGVIRVYKDGVFLGKATFASALHASTGKLSIGGFTTSGAPGGNYHNGHIDELRITKGVARYASDAGFTPPTEAFPRS